MREELYILAYEPGEVKAVRLPVQAERTPVASHCIALYIFSRRSVRDLEGAETNAPRCRGRGRAGAAAAHAGRTAV